MVNTQLLEDEIRLSGMKQNFIYGALGISGEAWNKKKKNKIPFRPAEIIAVCSLLRITDNEKKKRIFDAEEVV